MSEPNKPTAPEIPTVAGPIPAQITNPGDDLSQPIDWRAWGRALVYAAAMGAITALVGWASSDTTNLGHIARLAGGVAGGYLMNHLMPSRK